MGWFSGQIQPPPIRASSPVQFFHRWYSLVTPREYLRTWLTMCNPSWTTAITNRSEGKLKNTPKELELVALQAAQLYHQPPQQRGKNRGKKATIHITQWFRRPARSPRLLWCILLLVPSPQQSITGTHFPHRCRQTLGITIACQSRPQELISIPTDPSLGRFIWTNTIHLWDIRLPRLLEAQWCIQLPGMPHLHCIPPRGMCHPRYTHPLDKVPRCPSPPQGKNFRIITRFLGNCSPTPLLSQQFTTSEK